MSMINETNQLSEREREILRLVATGLSNQQIANQLGISPNTVKVHLRNVFGKISVASRTEATMYAVRAGIVEVEKAQISPPAVTETPTPPLAPEPAAIEAQFTPVVAPSPPQDSIVEPIAAATDVVERDEERPQGVNTATALPVAPRATSQQPGMMRWLLLAAGVVVGIALVVSSAQALGWLNTNPTPTPEGIADTGVEPVRWKALPDLPNARAAFALVSVADEIFIMGGENETGVLNSVERYNVTFGSWTNLADKPTPVTDIRAIVLGEKIYVPGGRTSADATAITTRFERYDPRTDSWDQLPDLPQPRSGYALAQVEGRLYVLGGWDGTSYRSEVFEFNPDANEWRERASMPTARAFADAVVINAGIQVLGGENQTGQLAANEVYTPSRENEQPWSRRSPLPWSRSRFSAIVEPAFSSIFVLGGDAANSAPLQYKTDRDRWEPIADPPQAIGSQPGVVQQTGSILVLGGKTGPAQYSASMQSYQAIYTGQILVP